MSRKYDLLTNRGDKISGFDAIESPKRARTSWKSWKCMVIGLVVTILVAVALTLLTVIIVEVVRHRREKGDVKPTNQCPTDAPFLEVPCSLDDAASGVDEEPCSADGCCLYEGRCLLNYQATCTSNSHEMFDCLPENDNWNDTYAKQQCTRRGCCWNNILSTTSSSPVVKCFYPNEYGYITNGTVRETPTGKAASITRRSPQPSLYSGDIEHLSVEVTYENENMLRVKIFDPKESRYEVPLNLTSSFKMSQKKKPSNTAYSIDISSDNFGFEIKRTTPNARSIFKTAPGFVFSEQFLQISAYLSSGYIYGLGEHATAAWRLNTNYSKLTMFSRDIGPDPVYDTGRNLYGVHPFYLCMEPDGSAHGVFFMNSNAMEVELLPYPAITIRTIGGIMDFYYFMGPTPEAVVSQYTELIGRPYMPPYWSLGFHLCRWGYLTANMTMAIVQQMRDLGIPQDTQWNDIDYMHSYLDFTYNHTTFKQLPDLVEDLHQHGQHYVVITDPGISATQPKGAYPPFDDGLEQEVFIKNSLTGQPILGKVWPGITAYPDFTNPNTEKYWENEIEKFHGNVKFDGLWIDMNEPSNFVPGSTSVPPCPDSSLNTPPFLPTSIRQSWDQSSKLIEKTLCMTAKQYISTHYNVHSLYGHTEAIATMNALKNIYRKRSLVISRSTYPGSGTHCGHWLGDNASQWPHLRQSIPGILNFALFGIPLVGADICGFFGDTNEQLCTRWQQLGAFYPFSRNHNTYNAIPQDPTQFGNYSINSTRDALLIRYKLLPFLYTLFYHAHISGATVGRPLLSVFPTDNETWTNDHQFMWGDALLISPVIDENATSVIAYFPRSRWYDYRTGMELLVVGNVMLEAPLNYIPLHVRGGSILPQQEPGTTTTASRKNPYNLLVALDDNENASGDLFIDDGEELDSAKNGHFTLLQFNATMGLLTSSITHQGNTPPPSTFIVNSVTVLGLMYSPENITYNGQQLLPADSWDWTDHNKVLSIGLEVPYSDIEFTLEWD